MYLFFNDMEEDFGYMMAGYKNGIITEERMNDALMRILGVKASIGLHKKKAAGTLVPPKENIANAVSIPAHHEAAKACADKSITLAKDTQMMLLISPEIHKHIRIHFLQGDGVAIACRLMKYEPGEK